MCGIVGLFLKDPGLQPQLGRMLEDMLVVMSDRGPDSAGFAIYGGMQAGVAKITVQAAEPAGVFEPLGADLSAFLGAHAGICNNDRELRGHGNSFDPQRPEVQQQRIAR